MIWLQFPIATRVKNKKDNLDNKEIKAHSMVEAIVNHNKKEQWWNVPEETPLKCKHNRPDIMI